MRQRIHNILYESLLFEKSLFRSIAIQHNGKVYEGKPWMTHAQLIGDIMGEDWFDDHEDSQRMWMEMCGFVTHDGEFVTRHEASRMVAFPESDSMRDEKELVEM